LIVIVLVLTIFSYVFLLEFLPHKLRSDPYEDLHRSFQFSFITVSYSCCVLLAFWALTMTYLVGPGIVSQHFHSEALDPINQNPAALSDDEEEAGAD